MPDKKKRCDKSAKTTRREAQCSKSFLMVFNSSDDVDAISSGLSLNAMLSKICFLQIEIPEHMKS